ncbi:glycosyltransferase [Microbulbifer sp. MCCC 1A16149]|uniref:glycosyltransferase n=1 Tax=Microbulbifer sp. MCCC 1A16149 TaxID=3411322 RepID=UPI003D0A73A1
MKRKKIAIASISETDKWGAGLSALKLHKAFLAEGLDSRLYVNRKFSSCENVFEIPDGEVEQGISLELGQYRSSVSDVPITTGLSSKSNTYLDRIWEEVDVVLLRWASIAISDFQIGRWSQRGKPIVWCLSDMAPLTGGCHYSMGCSNYTDSCSPCPLIDDDFFYSPAMVLQRRKNLWRNIVFVSPSQWLANICEQSVVSKQAEIKVIKTGVELDIFRPYIKSEVREEMGLPQGKKILMYGAASVNDSRKGAKFLPKLIEALVPRYFSPDELTLLITGGDASVLPHLPIEAISLGHLADRNQMAKAYSAADATLLPYVEDNLPNQCLESIACGTPVAAFDIGGMPDVIVPGVTGSLAIPFNIESLSESVIDVLGGKIDSSTCRNWAEKNLDIASQARKYLELFERLCGNSLIECE